MTTEEMTQIKGKMTSGDIQGAAAELKALLAAEPDNAEAQMLYGTCCHLLGDDKTFGEIHDALAPKMEKDTDEITVRLWRKYRLEVLASQTDPLVRSVHYAKAGKVVMEYVIMAVLIIASLGTAIVVFWPTIRTMFGAGNSMADDARHPYDVRNLYAGVKQPELQRGETTGRFPRSRMNVDESTESVE